MRWRALFLAGAMIGGLGAGPAPTQPVNPPATGLNAAQRARFPALREAALGNDIAASKDAIKELHSWGIPARRALIDLLRQVLARDKTAIEQAALAVKDPAKVKGLEDKIDSLRAQALENIKKLDKGDPVKTAHELYQQLTDLVGQQNQVNQARLAVADGLTRRAEFLPLFRSTAPATDVSFNQAAETRLLALAEKAMGMSARSMLSIPGPEDAKGPSDPAERRVWFYRCCRQIEAYNTKLAQQICDREEAENLRCVNHYRECLGIMPYELDARLVQAARRHSKEMVDLKYFAHESPTESERSHVQRMKNAGYSGGYSENIAMGPGSGERVFLVWFDSPGHHKNMAGGSVGFGVGRWRNVWTQNMGRAKRLMLLSEQERANVAVEGAILKPDVLPRGRR